MYRIATICSAVFLLAACSTAPRFTTSPAASRPSRTPAAKSSEAEVPTAIKGARADILAEARAWLGTPYRYGGNSRSGVDCSGFVTQIYADAGVRLPRRARDMYGIGTPVQRGELKPGDLVFFKNTAGHGITHVGIYHGEERFIHASTSRGVVYSSLTEAYYDSHYAGARKVLR